MASGSSTREQVDMRIAIGHALFQAVVLLDELPAERALDAFVRLQV